MPVPNPIQNFLLRTRAKFLRRVSPAWTVETLSSFPETTTILPLMLPKAGGLLFVAASQARAYPSGPA